MGMRNRDKPIGVVRAVSGNHADFIDRLLEPATPILVLGQLAFGSVVKTADFPT